LSLLDPIENGVDCDAFRFRSRRIGYALVLARICPEKGVHHALDAARRANIDLLIGGAVHRYPEHEAYWRDEIAPRLDRRRRFLGPLDFARKRRLLSAARCVLIPSLAAETSSLVAMEAMASGAPVIAFASGALPDLVELGRTGLLVRSMEEMAEAITRVDEINPAVCRSVARERFSADRMASRYLDLYERLASRRASAA
jgi:glycosyltransferase involved in cell wall biosynthesis